MSSSFGSPSAVCLTLRGLPLFLPESGTLIFFAVAVMAFFFRPLFFGAAFPL